MEFVSTKAMIPKNFPAENGKLVKKTPKNPNQCPAWKRSQHLCAWGGRWDVRDDIIDRPSCECLHGPAADAKPCCRSVLVLLKAVPESLRLLEGGGGSRKLSNDAPYVTFACLKAELW